MILGPEERMRTMHDGILIGVGTAMNDNPQLNGRSFAFVCQPLCTYGPERHLSLVRHLPFPPQNTHLAHYHHPRPIIVDPSLRLSKKCKLIANASKGAGVAPWLVAARPSKAEGFWASEGDADDAAAWEERKEALEAAGAKVILIEQPVLRTSLICSYV